MDDAPAVMCGLLALFAVLVILTLLGSCESNHPVLTPLPTGSSTTLPTTTTTLGLNVEGADDDRQVLVDGGALVNGDGL